MLQTRGSPFPVSGADALTVKTYSATPHILQGVKDGELADNPGERLGSDMHLALVRLRREVLAVDADSGRHSWTSRRDSA